MADEARIVGSLTFQKGSGTRLTASSTGVNATVAGEDCVMQTQTATTTRALLGKGNITSVGLLFIRNLDATNNLKLSVADEASHDFATLLPGEFALLRLARQPYIESSAATVLCEYLMLEA